MKTIKGSYKNGQVFLGVNTLNELSLIKC